MSHDDEATPTPREQDRDRSETPTREDVSDGSTVRSPEDASLNDDD